MAVPSPISRPREGSPRSPAYPHLVRRTIGYRLPRRSLMVDVAWRPGSPLHHFADDYPTVAFASDPPESPDSPMVRAAVGHLPLAGASVDCALLLDPVGGLVGGPGTLVEVARVLRPGGLVVVSASMSSGDPRSFRRRETVAGIIDAFTDLGLAPEQVTHLEPLSNPMSLMSRIQVRARSGRPGEAENTGLPFACRVVASLNRLDWARDGQRRRSRASSVLVFGRKP